MGWRDRMRQRVARLPVQHGDPDADTVILDECAPLAAARARATRHLLHGTDRDEAHR